jgi:hypothetical protein
MKRLIALAALSATFLLPDVAVTTASPAVQVPASAGEVTTTIHFSGVPKPAPQDIALGALSNDAQPDMYIVPTLTVGAIQGSGTDWDATVTVGNLVPFGDSTVPVLLKRQPNQTLVFRKTGIIAKPSTESGFAVQGGNDLLIVLENTTAFAYPTVRIRLRVDNVDVCHAEVDTMSAGGAGDKENCDDPAKWATFSIPKYPLVTLRITPDSQWFKDPQSQRPKSAKRKGTLSVQFVGAGTPPAIYEQTLPIEVQFDPGKWSIFFNIVWVFLWLLSGSLVALVLRVAIPNYRRKSTLKQQIGDVAKATRGISDAVDSNLRVLLRVERLNLEQIRSSAWISSPEFDTLAQRVEQGLATLKRKIDLARRLDLALGRKAIVMDRDMPPTRVAAVEKELDSAAQTLMRDELAEPEWVFLQQRLDAADKLLTDPTQDDKDAFQAKLVQRWKVLHDFFYEGETLKIPAALEGVKSAFPPADDLPKKDDPDASKWISGIGLTRADLQLSALEVIRDYLFLAPSTAAEGRWKAAQDSLRDLCATPTSENLDTARLLIRQLADGVDIEQLEEALRAGEADIDMTPQSVQPNEKAKFSLTFRDPKLNTAAARWFVRCGWSFKNHYDKKRGKWSTAKQPELKIDAQAESGPPAFVHREQGWDIYHYLEPSVSSCDINVRFYVDGKEVMTVPAGQASTVLEYTRTIVPRAIPGTWAWDRYVPEALQLGAALLVPLATLAVTQADQGISGRGWELLGVGFGSETIRGILTGKPQQTDAAPAAAQKP